MRLIIIIVFFIFLFLNDGISQEDSPIVLRDIPLLKHFESTEYNGGIQSWNMDQDSNGILYIANNEGLLEFDGNSWTIYDVPFCTKLRAVKVDAQNRIFVGGQGQIGYFMMAERGLVFTSLLDKLLPEFRNIAETWKIIEMDNQILFSTESKLFVLDDSLLKNIELPGNVQMTFKVGNRLLVQLYDMGIFEFVGDKFIPIKQTIGIPEIVSILPSDEGNIFFSKSGNIYDIDRVGYDPKKLPKGVGAINDIIKLSSGEFAIGTQNSGLFLLYPDLSVKMHLTKNEGITNRTINSLYEDEFKNLWIALNNGIDYLELSLPLALINEEVGLEGTGYAACKYNGHIYLGTSNGLFVQQLVKKNGNDSYYEFIHGSEGQVYNLSIVENELVLNHHRGAFMVAEKTLTKFHEFGSWKFMETRIPGLILGGDYQGISFFKKKNNKWAKIRGIPNLNESSRVLEFENDSVLWMTHGSKGAYRFVFDKNMMVKNQIGPLGEDDGFLSNFKISVYSLNNRLVYTSNRGIFNFNNDSYTFTPNQFFNKWLSTDHVSELASNGSNRIYFIQNLKLGVLMQETFGTYKIETGLFRHINKFINDDLPNISLLDDQNILIGAKEGFIRYDQKKKFVINEHFHVLLRSVEIKTSIDSSITYSPSFIENKKIGKNQSIKFVYAAPYFDGFDDVKYSYRLYPLEKQWSRWLPLGEKEYPYLPPGKYTFEVRAINIYGKVSSITAFSYQVLNPWYLTSWAIFIYALCGLISIALVLIIQQRKHKEEKSIINLSSEKALQIKQEEIHQISEESRKEIDRLHNEKLRTEINLKNDQLTTITMQVMSNNEFIQDVRQKIASNLDKDGSQEELKRIIKTIDENLSDNNSWDQFAYHFDQVHSDYLKKLSKNNVRLSPREIKLAAFLRMNMSSKEISNLMNITVRGVELARYRLRKKMKLNRDQNLVEYLIELDKS